MSLTLAIALVVAAFGTSILSGVIGMGGGMTLLGAMTLGLPPAWVVPLHAIVQLFSNFTRTLVFLREVSWKIFGIYLLPMGAGVTLGTLLWRPTQASYLRPAIGVFILLFLLWRRFAPTLKNLPLWTFVPVGLFVGVLTLFVGATGPFVAPFFLRDDLEQKQIVATKAACQAIGHALKVPAFFSLGFDYTPHLSLVAAMVAAVILGTLVGKAILHRLSRRVFLFLFEFILVTMALALLLGPWLG